MGRLKKIYTNEVIDFLDFNKNYEKAPLMEDANVEQQVRSQPHSPIRVFQFSGNRQKDMTETKKPSHDREMEQMQYNYMQLQAQNEWIIKQQ